jgi:acyl-CoA thioester hydrolase
MQPTSDRETGRAFSQTYRVYYADTDAGGIVYHSRYLEFAERSRAEMLRHVGHPLVGPAGEQFVVRAAKLSWQKPARLDDLITCRTSIMFTRGACIRMAHDFLRQDEPLVDIEIDLVLINSVMKPTRIPDALRTRLARFLEGRETAQPSKTTGTQPDPA